MNTREWTSSDYYRFWALPSRRYLEKVEHIVLDRLVGSGELVVDVGGGYGRLFEVYGRRFARVVIVDHSVSMLKEARDRLQDHPPSKVILVAANVYALPFRDGIFDQAFMVRLMHHLADPPRGVRSIERILRPGGSFVLEYQNVRSLSNRIKKLLGAPVYNRDRSEPVPQREPMYWNFHPEYIQACVAPYFDLERRFGGGMLWDCNLLVRLLRRPEVIDQLLSGFWGQYGLTRQVFLELRSRKGPAGRVSTGLGSPADMFVCPRCVAPSLLESKQAMSCTACNTEYPKQDGIYDFR